jgi:hypothetical protein
MKTESRRRQTTFTINAGRATLASSICLLLALFLFLPAPADAQLYSASVAGTVTDSSGAVVPSAKVTLVDDEKGVSFKGMTDASGRYLVRQVPPGSYHITAEAPGFQTQRKDGIKLDINQNASVSFNLKPGMVTQTVEVQAQGVQLATEDAVTGQTVAREVINNLPLLDRDIFNLETLAPGVVGTNEGNIRQTGVNFNANGSRNSTADMLIDGTSATNFEQNSGITNVPYEPSVDSVQEFKVEESNFNAEFGFSGGTIINVVTRSGTNQLHGALYEFLRNEAFNANDWFNNHNGLPIPQRRHHNFGGSIGGPIKRNKTFFFFDYETRLFRDPISPNPHKQGVPSLLERKGDFGELCAERHGTFDATGMCSNPGGQLWDPYSGTFSSDPAGDGSIAPGAVRSNFIPFNNLANYISPGNPNLAGTPFQPAPGVPGNILDPVGMKLLQLYPLPNVISSNLATNQRQNFVVSGSTGLTQNQWDLKIDHHFNDSNILSAKYSQRWGNTSDFNCFKNVADPCTGGPAANTRHLFSANYTHTLRPNLLLTVTYGLVRGFDFAHGIGGEFPNIDASFASLGLPSYLNHGFHVLPRIGLGSGYSAPIGTQTFSITREGQDSHHLGGAMNWIRGKHELKFGLEGRMYRINHTNPGWPSGFFNFDRTGTSQISSVPDQSAGGDSLASLALGVGPPSNAGGGCTPCQVGFINAVSTQSFRYAAFIQDNYRLSPKLTFNLGLRYEIALPRTERFNRMNWIDPNAVSPLSLTPALNGVPAPITLHGGEVFANPDDRSNYYIDYKNVQPRFGFAYQALPNFVIRGGYGIYFLQPRSGAAGTGPWGYQGFDIQPPWITTFNFDGATPYNTLKNTSCAAPDSSGNVSCGVPPPPGASLGLLNDIGTAAVGPIRRVSQPMPYEQVWSFGFQKELPQKTILDASYLGKKGTHLYLGGFRDLNFLGPQVLALSPTDRGNLTNLVPNPFFFSGSGPCDVRHFICDPTVALSAPEIQAFQSPTSPLHVPFPQFTNFQGDSPPIANSIYHALQVRVERQFAKGLEFLATYTWSKSIDNASATDDSLSFLGGGQNGGTLGVQNPNDLAAERSVSVFDITHVLQLSYVYELPIGTGRLIGRNMPPVLNTILGGWQTNGIVRITSGLPIIPTLANTAAIPTWGQRPNLNGSLGRASGRPQGFTNLSDSQNYFANPDALSQPDDFTLGTSPRTIGNVRQPGARDVSMSLFKEFLLNSVREGMRLELRAESFNTFNHPQFAGPDASFGSDTYGKITGTANEGRQLQFGVKLYY